MKVVNGGGGCGVVNVTGVSSGVLPQEIRNLEEAK